MAWSQPVLLGSEHDVARFDCGDTALNYWLVNRGLSNQLSGASRTWVVTEEGSTVVVAYYASATASVQRSIAPPAMRRRQPDPIPAILLARLAVDVEHQGHGLGPALLKHFMQKAVEVSALVGARLILVHAASAEAEGFYEHFGFVASPIEAHTLMMIIPEAT